MSRRAPNPAADRAAQNQQTIKTLLKLEANKHCADCKRNKHPRWASWNLGIFICIRCSGIHRGMGTHISRVKSVDLDAWTDEQLESVLHWGNTRANKYWEAKLAPGHVPSEAKIENFIRTKYESKRWTMEGPRPDPATLDDDGDDDVPLNVVQEKAKLDRSASQQKLPSPARPTTVTEAKPPGHDIFGDIPSPPARPSTTDTPNTRSAPAKTGSSTKQAEPANSLLGLDFFGGSPSAATAKPTNVSSTSSASTGPSRPDLKQSILSLYASTPRTQNPPQHERQTSFGGMQSPPIQSNAQGGGLGGMDDAFSSLTFSSTTSLPSTMSQPPSKPNPFAAFDQPTSHQSTVASPQLTTPAVKGGGFFNPVSTTNAPKPAPTSKPPANPFQSPQNNLSSLAFGDLGLNSSSSSPPQPKPTSASNQSLFDFAEPTPQTTAPKVASPTTSSFHSAFNLSSPASNAQGPPKPAASKATQANAFVSLSSADPWGSNDAWATPDPAASTTSTTKPAGKAPSIATTMDFSSWGGASSSSNPASGPSGASGNGLRATPKITEDEDFGGWTSAASIPTVTAKPAATASSTTKPASGFSASEDLFSNVWE